MAEFAAKTVSVIAGMEKGLFIDGAFVDGLRKETFATYNPATGEPITRVARAYEEDVDRAVKAAKAAFRRGSPWRTLDATARGGLLYKLAELMERDRAALAGLDAIDNGKPYADAFGVDLHLAIKCFKYYAGWADKITGTTVPIDGKHFSYTRMEPVGVVGQIIPWNFPLLMLAWKLAPALTAGNVIVLKTAEQTPLSGLYMASLIREAGFPAGVVNILSGFGPCCGAAIVKHIDVDKVAFTGSSEVGRIIQREAAGTLKSVTLELGGKSPVVVLPDADIDKAIDVTQFALFFNQGQVCSAGSRVYVHESIYDAFVARSVARAKARTIGDCFSGAAHGPQVDKEQFDKILRMIDSGVKEGAKLMCGGSRAGDTGFFIQPTVFADVQDHMTISREEIFGPVQQILKYSSLDEVIERCNDTRYGLGAAICGKGYEDILTAAHAIRAGSVWVNCYNVLESCVPFGGYKESGSGRELGEYGLRQYSEIKTVTLALPSRE